jgi:hypothetical protein
VPLCATCTTYLRYGFGARLCCSVRVGQATWLLTAGFERVLLRIRGSETSWETTLRALACW